MPKTKTNDARCTSDQSRPATNAIFSAIAGPAPVKCPTCGLLTWKRGGVLRPHFPTPDPSAPRFAIMFESDPCQAGRLGPISTNPPTHDVDGNLRMRRLRLDPDMVDGEHWTVSDVDATFIENMRTWMAEAEVGDEVTLRLIEMSDAEVKALPEI